MAKQKKNRKRPHTRISKKSKTLFTLVALPLTLFPLIALFASYKIFYHFVKFLFNKDAIYCEYLVNGFSFAIIITLFLCFLSGIIWLGNATSLKIDFKEYFSGKVETANKQIKKVIISYIILIVFFITFLCFQVPSRLVATTDSITEYHLSTENTIIDYKDIESAKVEYKRTYRTYAKPRHEIVITIQTNNTEIEFYDGSFNNNLSNIIAFLNCIDRNKIVIDKTNTEYTIFFTAKDKDAFKEIFELDE